MKIQIEFKGVYFDVEFDYQPEEKMVMYYGDGSGYPGCAEEANITSIKHEGVDFSEFLEDYWEELEEKILETLHSDEY